MDQLIDLHTHTYYSDGDFSPSVVLKHALEHNISHFAITDHDTIKSNNEIINHIPDNINFVTGVELTAKVNTGKMHILGYNLDLNNINLNNTLREVQLTSIDSVLKIIDQIKKDYHIIFPSFEIDFLLNTDRNIGRPAVSRLCVKYGYASHSKEAFDRYLSPAYEKTRHTNKTLLPEECLDLIINAGGIPVLAHPNSLKINNKELLLTIRQLITDGLKGIEAYNSSINPVETSHYLEIAQKYNLLISGGTDYHGHFIHPDVKIGTGKNNNVKIKTLSLIDHLTSLKQ